MHHNASISSFSPSQRKPTSTGGKKLSFPMNTAYNTYQLSGSESYAKPSMLEGKDIEGLSPQTPIIVHVDLPEETTQVGRIHFKSPPLPLKMLEPFDHFHAYQYPERTDMMGLKQKPELGILGHNNWHHFAAKDMEVLFDPGDGDSGVPRFDFDRPGVPAGSFLFGVEQDESFLVSASATRDGAPLIVAHTVPRELHRVLSSTTFEYNPVMRSLVFNIGMGLSLDALAFDCWVHTVNQKLSQCLPIVDVLITVDTSATSVKGGDEADEAFLAVLWIIALLRSTRVNVQGLSLDLPPHLPVSQAAMDMASTRGFFNRNSPGTSADHHLDCLGTLSYSGSLSLLNALLPASAMHDLQILVINDAQVSLDDVVILLKQAPKLISLEVGTLTDCYPALLPVYQTVASRSGSPDSALYRSISDDDTATSGSVVRNVISSADHFDSRTLSAGNVVNNKVTDYPYLETLSLKHDATVSEEKLFKNVKMSGLKSLVSVPMVAHA